ncbi:MAG: signal peptide peptidase SppA [Candidatus Zixiibacteriota bacterium]
MKTFLAVIGGIAIIVVLAAVFVGLTAWLGEDSVPSKTILEIDFERAFVEYVPNDPVAQTFFGKDMMVRDVVEALEKAAGDDRVIGLVAHIGVGLMGGAITQEFRDAVINFRQHGKKAIAWSETFGEFGPGSKAYYLATAFDEIYLQPSGDIGLTGIMSESPFIKGTLDKLDIEPRMGQRYEYKNAANMFNEKSFTPAHREATSRILESMYEGMVADIAKARSKTEDEIKFVIDHGPLLGKEALTAGLVDGMAYRDEVYEKVKALDKDAQLLYLSEYLDRAGRPHADGEDVALIYGVGSVVRGSSGYDPLFSSVSMGSATVAQAFRKAIDDKKIKAILFRVDSPGGSYVASDVIWREVVRARKAGKPVIVSMGDVAGSGGYFVAMPADKIVAQPATITGSIGVLGGKMYTTGFWEKLGITWDEVHFGQNATFWSGTEDYSPSEKERSDAWLDRIYEDFTTKVAEGRNLPIEKVKEIAKGRVWTGSDALELGLVDELGGFPVAIRLIKETLNIPEGEDIELVLLPKEKSIWNALMGDDADNSEGETVSLGMAKYLKAVQPYIRFAAETGLIEDKRVLMMPAMEFSD